MSVSPLAYGPLEFAGAAAEERLAQMGLTSVQLTDTLRRGDRARSQVSPLAPRTFPGQMMWAECVAELRRQLVPLGRGWRADSSRNFETVINDALGFAIAIVGGNQRTGLPGAPLPTTARPRGPVSLARVAGNREEPAPLPGFRITPSSIQTWFLLIHGSDSGIRAELSLPTSWSSDRVIDQWAVRILLPEIGSTGAVTPDDEPDPVAPIVTVSRR